MSVLMNIEDTNVTLGTTLKEFKEFCGALDPETKVMLDVIQIWSRGTFNLA